MAEYDHIVAEENVYVNGVLAFAPGDPIPVDTAERIGIKGKTVKADTSAAAIGFEDASIKVTTSKPADATDEATP